MTSECTQFVFGFHPQKRREIRPSSIAERSAAMAAVCSCGARGRWNGGSLSRPRHSPRAQVAIKVLPQSLASMTLLWLDID